MKLSRLFAIWRHQVVLRDLIEVYQKVLIFALQTWTVSFQPIKKTNIKKINNNEALHPSNNKGHSFITSIAEDYDDFPSSKSMPIWSDIPLL